MGASYSRRGRDGLRAGLRGAGRGAVHRFDGGGVFHGHAVRGGVRPRLRGNDRRAAPGRRLEALSLAHWVGVPLMEPIVSPKAQAELAFWESRIRQQGILRNDHFEYFYTTLFGLDKPYYRETTM